MYWYYTDTFWLNHFRHCFKTLPIAEEIFAVALFTMKLQCIQLSCLRPILSSGRHSGRLPRQIHQQLDRCQETRWVAILLPSYHEAKLHKAILLLFLWFSSPPASILRLKEAVQKSSSCCNYAGQICWYKSLLIDRFSSINILSWYASSTSWSCSTYWEGNWSWLTRIGK